MLGCWIISTCLRQCGRGKSATGSTVGPGGRGRLAKGQRRETDTRAYQIVNNNMRDKVVELCWFAPKLEINHKSEERKTKRDEEKRKRERKKRDERQREK